MASICTNRPAPILVIAYCAIAVVMHRKLGRLVRGGDSVEPLLHGPER